MRWVAFSSIFAGLSGYVVILIATQTLGAARFEAFNVFWGLFFAISGTVQGIMHETTRGVRHVSAVLVDEDGDGIDDRDQIVISGGSGGTPVVEVRDPAAQVGAAADPPARTVRPLRVALVLSAIFAVLVAATGPAWSTALIPEGYRGLAVALGAVSTALLTWQAALAGLLSGSGRWRSFGILLTVEAALRLAVAAIAIALADPMTGFMYATVAGTIATPFWLLATRPGHEVAPLRTDVPLSAFLRRCGSAMLAASAAAVLVVGFPVLIKASRPDADPFILSNLLLAVTLTRAPILVPITSFQNAIVVFFVDRLAKGRGAVVRPLALVTGIAVLGAALAWFIGPPIIGIMGDGFQVGGDVLAALTLAAGATGALYVTGSATLARERHGSYVAGWWIACGLTVILLVSVPGLVVGTILSLAIGPAVGALFHILVGMRRTR